MVKPWFEFLIEWIPNKLPGETAHLELSPMRKLSSIALKEADFVRDSAVAIHLFETKNGLQIVLTLRTIYEGAHSGQVSFPGGKRELSDLNLAETARRESYEEIGIAIHEGILIGELTEVFIPVSKFRVKPFVFYHVSEIENLIPDPKEVKSIFFLPHDELLKDEILGKMDVVISPDSTLKDVPCFLYNDFTIWGATAIILNELKQILKQNN